MKNTKKIFSSLVISSLLLTQIPFVQANETISAEEQQKVQTAILDLQTNIFNNSKTLIEKLTDDFTKYTNYESSGLANVELKVDQAFLWNIEAKLELPEYSVKQNGLDSDTSGKVNFTFSQSGSQNMNGNMSTLFSLIQKKWEIFAQLKNFTGSSNDPSMQSILEEVKTLFPDESFYKLSNDEQAQAFALIQNFSPKNILSTWEEISKNPLFEAYKKEGDKYYLAPTQYACDTFFEINNTLNSTKSWYTPETCTPSVYKTFVKKVQEAGDFYIIVWSLNNKLVFETQNDTAKLTANIVYNKNTLGSMSFELSNLKNSKDTFQIKYFKNRYLKINFQDTASKSSFVFDGQIKDGTFKTISSQVSVPKVMKGNFALQNNRFAGKYYFFDQGSEYNEKTQQWKTVTKNTYFLQLAGVPSQVGIEKMNAKMIWVENATKEQFMNMWLKVQNNTFEAKAEFTDNYEVFQFNSKGSFTKKSLDMTSNFQVGEYLNDKLVSSMNGNFNLKYDGENNNDDLNLLFNLSDTQKEIASLKIVTDGQITYKDGIIIEAPKDFKEFDMGETIIED